MDCRRSWLVALGLAGAVLGCGPEDRTRQLTPEPPITAQLKNDSDTPKRKPKADTCVAMGNFHEREADTQVDAPALQERYRDLARREYQQALAIDPKDAAA